MSPKNLSPSLPRSITALSLHSLRIELSRRNLDTCGLRATLEQRLAADLTLHFNPVSTSLSSPSALHADGVIGKRRRGAISRATLSVPRLFPGECRLYAELPKEGVEKKKLTKENKEKQVVADENGKLEDTGREEDPNGECQKGKKVRNRFVGVWQGESVWIMGDEQMHAFWTQVGPCGKGNLSRSAPSYARYGQLDASSVKGRALRQLLVIEEREERKGDGEDKDTDRVDGRKDVEHLQLTLVEAFYESFLGGKRLEIRDIHGVEMGNIEDVWRLFSHRDVRFGLLLVAYCRYRAVGWRPRSGVKYGVDWVLYPESSGGGHAHAPYCVVLKLGKEGRVEKSWTGLQNRLRLCKSVAKNLVIARVWAKDGGGEGFGSFEEALRMVEVVEITVDRWLP